MNLIYVIEIKILIVTKYYSMEKDLTLKNTENKFCIQNTQILIKVQTSSLNY